MLLWDLRNTGSPTSTVVPDGKPVLQMKLSPFGDSIALGTVAGVHSVDLMDGSRAVTPVTPPGAPLAKPFVALEYNLVTGELYASSQGGTISVYRASPY